MIESISLLGNPNAIQWEMTKEGLIIQLPDNDVDPISPVFKIQFKGNINIEN